MEVLPPIDLGIHNLILSLVLPTQILLNIITRPSEIAVE